MDWRAQFKFVFPNGREVLIDAAHDHKGSSIYNELHAQKRAAMFGKTAHAFIAGHRHTPAIQKSWLPEEEMESWFVRVASYKWHDSHAKRHGFPDYRVAPAIAMVIDPRRPAPIVTCTEDIDLARTILECIK
jgi:hypothetical protein